MRPHYGPLYMMVETLVNGLSALCKPFEAIVNRDVLDPLFRVTKSRFPYDSVIVN